MIRKNNIKRINLNVFIFVAGILKDFLKALNLEEYVKLTKVFWLKKFNLMGN